MDSESYFGLFFLLIFFGILLIVTPTCYSWGNENWQRECYNNTECKFCYEKIAQQAGISPKKLEVEKK